MIEFQKPRKEAKVICVLNEKGGVGKTTLSLNFGKMLAEIGKKVLIVDVDNQSSMTICFGIPRPDELETTIYDLMNCVIDEKEFPEKSKCIISKGNLDLIPCSIELSALEMGLVSVMSRELILKMVLENFKYDYDFVLIDCPPALGMITINALAASDSVIIPTTAQYLSIKGLELLLGTISKVKR